MSSTGLEVFDTTVQKTNEWLKFLGRSLHSDDRNFAYLALRGGLQALRDRLQPEAAIHLGAQLPLLVRGIFYEGWSPGPRPTKDHEWQDLVERTRQHLPPQAKGRAEDCTIAVFSLLCSHLDIGEVRKIGAVLPRPLADRWQSCMRDALEARSAGGERQAAASHEKGRQPEG